MRIGIRTRLAATFAIAFLLVGGAVVATFVALQTQAADVTVINLAGRRRMLIQGLTRAVVAISGDPQGLDFLAAPRFGVAGGGGGYLRGSTGVGPPR